MLRLFILFFLVNSTADGCYIDNTTYGYPVQICPNSDGNNQAGVNGYQPNTGTPNYDGAEVVSTLDNGLNNTSSVQNMPVIPPTSTPNMINATLPATNPSPINPLTPNPVNSDSTDNGLKVNKGGKNENLVKKTIKVTKSRDKIDDQFSEIESKYPDLMKKVKEVFAYNGIMMPWDRVKDFLEDKQQPMPSPNSIYKILKEYIVLFHYITEMVSEQINTVNVYISRGKEYLKEDVNALERHLEKLKKSLRKIKADRDPTMKTEDINEFNKLNEEAQKTIARYKEMKAWLKQMINNLKQLFQ